MSKFSNIVAVVLIALACVGLYGLTQWMGSLDATSESTATVRIDVDGETLYNLQLSENAEQAVTSDYGTNVVQIKDGKVRVREADCPNQDCVDQGWIDNTSAQIVCLPHKLTVQIVDKDNADDLDVLAQ